MNTTDELQVAITTNPHDGGHDLVRGRDITGPRFGDIYREDDGVVLRIFGDDEHLPDTLDEAVAILVDEGYALSPESLVDVEALFA